MSNITINMQLLGLNLALKWVKAKFWKKQKLSQIWWLLKSGKRIKLLSSEEMSNITIKKRFLDLYLALKWVRAKFCKNEVSQLRWVLNSVSTIKLLLW